MARVAAVNAFGFIADAQFLVSVLAYKFQIPGVKLRDDDLSVY